MALAESMLGAANHLAGNHPVAQKHFESGLSYSASGSRFRAGQHLFHHTSLLLVGMARSLLYRGLFDQALDLRKTRLRRRRKIRSSGHVVSNSQPDPSGLFNSGGLSARGAIHRAIDRSLSGQLFEALPCCRGRPEGTMAAPSK